ncbi:MAG: hypothetical protein HN742_18190 [Lentisphaerae bacterium]|jgi:lipopolysaccharide transport protein LptA|nr:hypothetical protein [Lentisphaerota bacterium]MBT4815245.1 hypothetical protein [Lentisphaerota bacterium]MBT5611835.1 hypothetical protein [Lentisphaerota bacterium]MBT7059292.1 hypothetical protein [Lentisphaerota bacterium]MBT7843815.1 hypothetical protein [Lentisphaerota bacterium]
MTPMNDDSDRRASGCDWLRPTATWTVGLLFCGACVFGAGDSRAQEKGGEQGADKVATGEAAGTEETDNLSVTADTLDMDFVKKMAVFVGNVEVSDSKMTLKADHMDVYLTDEDDLKKIVATGNVVIHEPASARQATAGKAIYDVIEGTVILTDTPTIVDGENTVTEADTITYFRNSDKFRFEGRPVFHVKTKKGKKSLMPSFLAPRKESTPGN